jgi:hypothetical protein
MEIFKICDFHCSDYEECRRLRCKTPVRTSQETHYISATKHKRLTLCKIWGFHGGNYEEYRGLRYKNPVRTSQETYLPCIENLKSNSALLSVMVANHHNIQSNSLSTMSPRQHIDVAVQMPLQEVLFSVRHETHPRC